jgi:hypothetical protein
MKAPIYSSSCTVIKSRKEPDLFYMNMSVYEVEPSEEYLQDRQEENIFNIWCAVHHIQVPTHQNKQSSSWWTAHVGAPPVDLPLRGRSFINLGNRTHVSTFRYGEESVAIPA